MDFRLASEGVRPSVSGESHTETGEPRSSGLIARERLDGTEHFKDAEVLDQLLERAAFLASLTDLVADMLPFLMPPLAAALVRFSRVLITWSRIASVSDAENL